MPEARLGLDRKCELKTNGRGEHRNGITKLRAKVEVRKNPERGCHDAKKHRLEGKQCRYPRDSRISRHPNRG